MASGQITNGQIVQLAEAISVRAMKLVALRYMGLRFETIKNLQVENRGDSRAFNRVLIWKWTCMNPGPNQVKVSTGFSYLLIQRPCRVMCSGSC